MAVGHGGVLVEVLMLPRLQRYRRDACGRNRPVLHLIVEGCVEIVVSRRDHWSLSQKRLRATMRCGHARQWEESRRCLW